MTKTNLTIAALALILTAILTVAAISMLNLYQMPQEGTIQIELVLEGQPYVNGTTIQWGNMLPGLNYSKALDFNNTNSFTVTLGFGTYDLPAGWIQNWNLTNTQVLANTYAYGNLTLAIPPTATEGTFDWEITIYAEQATA